LRLTNCASLLAALVLLSYVCTAPRNATAQTPAAADTAVQVERLSVHGDRVLVPSFQGFGVQLDPYQYPPTEKQWEQIRSRLDILHPAFIRVMFNAEIYCRRLDAGGCDHYVWRDAADRVPEEFHQLLRILDYAEQHKTPVMLGEWSWPHLPHGEAVAPIKGPDDPRWAEIIAPLLVHLTRERHYTVLRFYNYMNEPNGGWMWPGGDAGVDYRAWKRGFIHARQVFDQVGLHAIAMVGPDNSGDWNWLDNTVRDAASSVGGWEMHWYPTDDEVTNGKVFKLLNDKREMLFKEDSSASSKPLFLGESGLITGRVNGDQQPRVRTFVYGVLMADYAAQVAQAGWMGASAWDLDDAMHTVKDHPAIPDSLTLKTWGFWNTESGAMGTPEDEKVRPWFRAWALLAHLFQPGSQILQVSDPEDATGVRAVAAKSASGAKTAWTILLVNDHDHEANVILDLPKMPSTTRWRLYKYAAANQPTNYENIEDSEALPAGTGRTAMHLPAHTVEFLTTGTSIR
jgi:hypothetical protein